MQSIPAFVDLLIGTTEVFGENGTRPADFFSRASFLWLMN
jgi:hypothetical protein